MARLRHVLVLAVASALTAGGCGSGSGGPAPASTGSPAVHHAMTACLRRGQPAEVLTCLASSGVKLTRRDAPLYRCLQASSSSQDMIACLRRTAS